MSDQDAFERILASLHEAMLDDALWPATSALIDEACGIQGNLLLVGEKLEGDILPTFVGLYYRGERCEELEQEYLTVYHPIDERVPRFRQLSDSRIVHNASLYTAEELKTSPVYNEALPKASTQDGLIVRLDGPAGSHISWATADPVAPGGWDSTQLALMQGLLPHIRQFVRVRQALVGAEALGASLTDLLNSSRMGVIYLDRRGRTVEANDRARRILRHGDGITDRSRILSARRPADQVRLERLLAAALPSADTAPVSGSMLLHRLALALPFVIHVKPVVSPQPDYGASHVAALVLIVEPERSSPLAPRFVAEVLGLTTAESQIAVRLAAGQTVREIAGATERTVETIRWHLKHIYHKHHLPGQTALVQLVHSLAEFGRLA